MSRPDHVAPDSKVWVSSESRAAPFAADCIEGLSRARKSLPCKWLYDDAGSQLFERITELEEYYPSRVEEALLEQAAAHIASLPVGPVSLVELGSGASRKTRRLLAATNSIENYIPIDISADELIRAQGSLCVEFPHLSIIPVCTDFTDYGSLDLRGLCGPILVFFPGSTLGNMAPPQAIAFLRELHGRIASDGKLLLGVDVLKDEGTLSAAYDDAAGVTAAFNLNLVERMRRELGAAIDMSAFKHRAIWNAEEHRIEMHLEATSRQTITVLDRYFVIEAGETIHTESSYKLSVDCWRDMFRAAGWRIEADWQSPPPQFLLTLLTAESGD